MTLENSHTVSTLIYYIIYTLFLYFVQVGLVAMSEMKAKALPKAKKDKAINSMKLQCKVQLATPPVAFLH